jgi:hypothetical protein
VVADDFEDDGLDVRPLAPVVAAPLDYDFFSRHTADEGVGTAADRAVVEVVAEIAFGVDVLRNHHHIAEAGELRRQRFAEADFDGVVVDRARPGEVHQLE